MKVMVYLGKATPRVVNGLKSMSDDIDFSVYTSVSTFVQEAELRHLSFNRIVFNNRFVSRGEQDYIQLNNYIKEFSNATELVMVINDGDKESEDLFNKYFSSPLYTYSIVKGATSMDFFRDIVASPIIEVRARYYTLNKEANTKKPEGVVGAIIGGFQGGIKKSPETINSNDSSSEAAEPMSNVGVSEGKSSDDTTIGNATETQSNPISFGSTAGVDSEDQTEVSHSENDVPVLDGHSSSTSEDFSEDDEDALLSVGSFGSSHSDTGMFEEDEDGEVVPVSEYSTTDEEARKRREELEEQNRIAAEIQERQKAGKVTTPKKESKVKPGIDSQKVVKQNKKVWEQLKGSPYSAYKFNIIVGTTGSASAQQIVDDAVRMMEAGMNVLVVDMDFINNALLSYVNTSNFYKTGNNGYVDGRLFVEEHIGVISGGYGFTPSKIEIESVLCDKTLEKCDIVLVDCPAESIKLLPSGLLEGSNIIVFSGNDPSQIIATAIALTNRKNCTLSQERLIMSKSKSILTGDSSDLVRDTISNMMFANGCWLK